MTTFGVYSLVRAVPSYGGAEVIRARRWTGSGFAPAVHLALYGPANLQQRLIAAAESAAQARHERVARIHEIGRHDGSLYAVAEPLEGADLSSLLEHHAARRTVPEVSLAVATALALARVAAELLDRDVWAGARGAGVSALFAAGLRLDAVVLATGGVSLRPLAGAADDPAQPTPFRAPEIGARFAPASAATDVFMITQLLRALCAGDPQAASAPRLGPHTSRLAPILAAGLAPWADERLSLHLLIEQLALLLQDVAGERASAPVIERALASQYRSLHARAIDIEPAPGDARAAAQAPLASIAWPVEDWEDARTVKVRPANLLSSAHSGQEAVDRVFTGECAAAPAAVHLEIGAVGAYADETTQKMAVQPSRPSAARRSASDPPWASASDVEPVDGQRARPATAPVAIPSEAESGPTVETRSPLDGDDDETE